LIKHLRTLYRISIYQVITTRFHPTTMLSQWRRNRSSHHHIIKTLHLPPPQPQLFNLETTRNTTAGVNRSRHIQIRPRWTPHTLTNRRTHQPAHQREIAIICKISKSRRSDPFFGPGPSPARFLQRLEFVSPYRRSGSIEDYYRKSPRLMVHPPRAPNVYHKWNLIIIDKANVLVELAI
jgi:hypothetical protein